jgi:16S rRNA (guanine1516-N2)-methyltransferase
MEQSRYKLIQTEHRLELHDTLDKRSKPLYVDFLHGPLAHRRKYGGGRGQLIARAVGATGRSPTPLRVLDATAGLGRDAFVLASLGCKMYLLERSPIIAALLQDGLKRAQTDPEFANIDMQLTVTDAIAYLKICKRKYDVIYLDPMFPTRTKSALVKKEMRILRDLVGEDIDAEKLLKLALKIASKRVVVKRPKLAPAIPGPEPTLKFVGKSSRFDVYIL